MTPKEKAEELVYKYTELLGIFMDVNWEIEAKQCALIAVDEMLKIEKKYSNFGEYEFLQEVKKEIEKL